MSQLVAEARELVEVEFGDVWVEGEISNFRPAPSGHLYFTLKDAEAQLPVVLFRRQAILLRFRPEDGLQVRVRGKVSVYEQRGQLQLVAETLEPVGTGSLQLAFEQLRDKLKAEGLFDQERKRKLPAFARTVAVITSPTGAVIRDFLNIVSRRHAGLNVIVIPVSVQGDSAAGEIETAIRLVNDGSVADLIVIARGGGSLEDLAAFNSERVARAIAASELPVVSAVGHETDFTIADFVADLRAPTPSAAAELVTESHHRVGDLLQNFENRLIRAARYQVIQARQRLSAVGVTQAEQSISGKLHRLEQRLDDLVFRLESSMYEELRAKSRHVAALGAAVLQHDPRRELGQARELIMSSGVRMRHALDRKIAAAGHQREILEARLFRAAQAALVDKRSAFVAVRVQLQTLSPLAVLQRGYAVVQDQHGAVVRSAKVLIPDQTVQTRLSDGSFTSVVSATHASQTKSGRKTKDRSSD